MAKNMAKIIAEPGKQELIVEREVDAPRELVFRAFTEPDLYSKWIGPSNLTTNIETFEARPGGSYRFVQKDKEGKTYGFHGIYHEVRSPEKIVSTFEYEELPEPGHVLLDETKFEELPGNRTKIVDKNIFLNVEDRDGMLQSGMEEGMNDSYARLDALIEKIKVSIKA